MIAISVVLAQALHEDLRSNLLLAPSDLVTNAQSFANEMLWSTLGDILNLMHRSVIDVARYSFNDLALVID